MKILIGAILALLALVTQPAAAGQWRNFGGGGAHFNVQAQRQRPGGYSGGYQRQAPPQREFRQPERQPDRRPDGRMSDEERRNLHRDLDRANREIYKGR